MNTFDINQEKQDKASLIVADLASYVHPDVVYTSLYRRGVFKWLAVRRRLIWLKEDWKDRVTLSLQRQKVWKELRKGAPRFPRWWLTLKINEERGYRRGVEECRAELRRLCHSTRDTVADNDREAFEWFLGWHLDPEENARDLRVLPQLTKEPGNEEAKAGSLPREDAREIATGPRE